MAIEDGAVLGNLVSPLQPRTDACQQLHLHRTAETQNQSRLNQKIFRLPDGPKQQACDTDMRTAMDLELRRMRDGTTPSGDSLEGSANQWADERKNVIQFAYDADQAADRWWHNGGDRRLQAAVANGQDNERARL